ncbi:MAG: ABC transporter permease subunit [Clostridia bacterium]|nr:ABC transporter permease subunit [Clostridia bacterium]
MFAIFKKELRSYFINTIGFVYIGVFLTLSAALCCYTTLCSASYDTGTYFTLLLFSFVILIPLLTMKLFSEEKKLRTEQLLLTAPISTWGMIMGKFLAAFTLFVGTVLVSCLNLIPLYLYGWEERAGESWGDIHVGPLTFQIVGAVVGVILIGAAFIAIGLFISSLTENQLAAAVITVSIIVVFLLLDVATSALTLPTLLRYTVDFLCILTRFSDFASGMLDYSHILYYISVTGIFLLLAVRVYERRRWA